MGNLGWEMFNEQSQELGKTEDLLKECLLVLNQIPNHKVKGEIKDSYSMAKKIEKHLKES